MSLLSSIELGFPHCMETWDLPQVQRSHMFQSPGSHAKLWAKWNVTRLCNVASILSNPIGKTCLPMFTTGTLHIRGKILPPLRTEHGRGIREEAGNWYSLDSIGWFALSQVLLWKYWCVTSGFLAVLKQKKTDIEENNTWHDEVLFDSATPSGWNGWEKWCQHRKEKLTISWWE